MSALTTEKLLATDWRQLEGDPFEDFLAAVFDALGYSVEKVGAKARGGQGDHGVDLLVSAHELRVAVQAKGWPAGGQVGVEAVRAVNAGRQYYGCTAGWVVTNSTFGPFARQEAAALRCRLVDRARMPALIQGQVLPPYPSQRECLCPCCGAALLAPTRPAGSPLRCPTCSRPFKAPAFALSPEGRFRRGQRLVQEGDLAAGYSLLRELCQTHPWYQPPLLFCAEAYLERGRFRSALELYRRAVRLGPCPPDVYGRAAESACESGDFAEAGRLLDLAEQHVRRRRFTAKMWISRARVAAQQGQKDAAILHLRRAVRSGETDPARYETDRLLTPLFLEKRFQRLVGRLRRRQQPRPTPGAAPARALTGPT